MIPSRPQRKAPSFKFAEVGEIGRAKFDLLDRVFTRGQLRLPTLLQFTKSYSPLDTYPCKDMSMFVVWVGRPTVVLCCS